MTQRPEDRLNYPAEKLSDHMINVQLSKGLKKKDLFFERMMTRNQSLLSLNKEKSNEKTITIQNTNTKKHLPSISQSRNESSNSKNSHKSGSPPPPKNNFASCYHA